MCKGQVTHITENEMDKYIIPYMYLFLFLNARQLDILHRRSLRRIREQRTNGE